MHTQKTYIDYIHTFTYTFSPQLTTPMMTTLKQPPMSPNYSAKTQTRRHRHTQRPTHGHRHTH